MKNFNPRHLRKRHAARRSGPKDPGKSKAFRRCKRISDRFIHQSASALESPSIAGPYLAYRQATVKGEGFRKG